MDSEDPAVDNFSTEEGAGPPLHPHPNLPADVNTGNGSDTGTGTADTVMDDPADDGAARDCERDTYMEDCDGSLP